jgi:hypothetical protein
MTITSIDEIENENIPTLQPIKEIMDVNVPSIPEGVSRRNGMIYILTGSGGSGKTSLLLSMFKSKDLYRNKFNNIYYICPESSFLSVAKHPFVDHPKVIHELNDNVLYGIYDELMELKEQRIKKKKKPHYNLIILDDFADTLKLKHIQIALNKMLIKARHLNCGFIFTLQSYYYMPKQIRKQLTFCTIFKSKNVAEFETLARELLNFNKDDALKLYNYIFDEPYTHMDLDLVNNIVYKNFNKLIINEK